MKKIKEKIEGKQELSLDEERKLIEAKNLPLLKKYFQYTSVVYPDNEVQLVYNLDKTNVLKMYIKCYGFSSEHAQAACAKLCDPKFVKLMLKEELVLHEDVYQELLRRGDNELLKVYEEEWGYQQ